MIPIGTLQPCLPSPVAIPKDYSFVVIDIKVRFYNIPIYPDDF